MTAPIRAYWWSPRRDPRTLAGECRDHGGAWARLLGDPTRAFTNHGDELSELVLREAFGRPVRWAPLGREDVVAIGSIMVPYLTKGGVGLVWGSGVHTPDVAPSRTAGMAERVLAIRGPRARAALGLPDDTPLGDPGLLARVLRPRTGPRSGTVLVTHFTSYATAGERARIRAFRAAGVRIVLPTTAPDEMLRIVAGADHVISAGMHGVILAHALRTPATLVSLKEPRPTEPTFKYHDYFESVGLSAGLTPWAEVLDERSRSRLRDAAVRDLARADARIDDLVEGLLRAGAPLRSTH